MQKTTDLMNAFYSHWILLGILLLPAWSSGQHDHHRQKEKERVKAEDQNKHAGHHQQTDAEEPGMNHAFSLNLPMTRNGSGTGWLPDSTPMYGYMLHGKKWMHMFHGNIFVRYNSQDIFKGGIRGDQKFDAVNWFMGMGQRRVGSRGLFRFSAMLSLDFIFGGNGYPLLFQTGESWNGKPLVDRQHPHDLFSELSVGYAHSFSKNIDAFIYLGYPGEPALGSVAFMHRVSSLYGPDAPLSHHWNDGTHITFGVATGGIRIGKFKLEGSSFTGREPDENRLNFDKPTFDSYSARFSFNPTSNWALQISQGFIFSPEATRPDENVNRTTASAVYSKPLGSRNYFNGTVLYGLNRSHGSEHAALIEGVFVRHRLAIFGRYEFVQKSAEELDLNPIEYEHDARFGVHALTLGGSFDVLRSSALNSAVGFQGTFYTADSRLHGLYGRYPVSGQIFVRAYPPRMR